MFRTFAKFVTESQISHDLLDFLRDTTCADEHYYSTLSTVRFHANGVSNETAKHFCVIVSFNRATYFSNILSTLKLKNMQYVKGFENKQRNGHNAETSKRHRF